MTADEIVQLFDLLAFGIYAVGYLVGLLTWVVVILAKDSERFW